MVGLWIGKIQALEEFLDKSPTPHERLETLTVEGLEPLHRALHLEYQERFKRR